MISASLYDTLTIECIGPVALVTFRRAQQLNAMNKYMQAEITSTFELLSDDPDVRVIVVTGDGRAFMAGADIKEYATQSGPEFDICQDQACSLILVDRHSGQSHERHLSPRSSAR
jgi:enoyl-CoA hydratase/carnithine racemase